MANFRGTGILHGVSTNLSTGSLIVSCSFQSANYSSTFTEETVMNCNGEVVTEIDKDFIVTLGVEYVFTSGTNSGTATVVTPLAASLVTITDASHAAGAGTYKVMKVDVSETNSGAATVALDLQKRPLVSYA